MSKETVDDNFEQERNAYLEMKPDLMRLYKDQYVAIYHRVVIAADPDKIELIKKVRKEHGPIRVFIQKVEEKEVQVRLPTSRRLVDN